MIKVFLFLIVCKCDCILNHIDYQYSYISIYKNGTFYNKSKNRIINSCRLILSKYKVDLNE